MPEIQREPRSLGLRLPTGENPEAVLFQMEERYGRLCAEVAALEAQLRELRTAAELCPMCGGAGERWVRGGLYGESQKRACPCRKG
jgi:hypothetical protein